MHEFTNPRTQKKSRQNKPRDPTLKHNIIKLPKDKQRILKAATEMQFIPHKGSSLKFSAETLEARRQWDDIVKVFKRKNHKLRILYLTKLSFKKLKEKLKQSQINKS